MLVGIDYINASYIDGHKRSNAYICTTSPFNESCCLQFWQMIYEQNVTVIAMVTSKRSPSDVVECEVVTMHSCLKMTNMVDEDIVKCVEYWPQELGSQLTFGNITIETVDVEVFAYFSKYTMTISYRGSENMTRCSSSHNLSRCHVICLCVTLPISVSHYLSQWQQYFQLIKL